MNIIDNRETCPYFFANLRNGEVFDFNGDIFVKVDNYCGINAIMLKNGNSSTFEQDDVVTPVNCELVIS